MLLGEQTLLHAPQFEASAPVLTSQPFACLLPSQSVKPAAQMPLQTPPEHVRVAMPALEQTTPQPPQLSGSLELADSQPFVCLSASQSL